MLCSVTFSRAHAQTNFPESEPNDNNAGAQLINCVVNGDTITGTTSGTSTTVAGLASADTFRVRTCVQAAGIYRNRFSLSNPSATGSGGTLRGFTQATGVINTTSDGTFQTGSGSGTIASPRIDQWYSFGPTADVYYRVTGAAATSASLYTATFSQISVAPIVVAGTLNPGSITIARAVGNTTDTDFWVYDSSFNALATFGNDDPNTLTRTYAAGTYYLAIANFNTANDQPSPVDDTFRSGGVMPFPGTIANSSTATAVNVSMTFTDGSSTLTGTGSKAGAFDVVFFQFTVAVAPPANDNCASASAISGSGTLTGNTSLATNDGPTDIASCDPGGNASRTVFYSYTAGATGGTLLLDTCLTTVIDSVLTVWDVCYGTELACNDNCGGSPCGANASCVGPLTLTPNQNIKIRISDKGLVGGAFTMHYTYTPFPPPNDDCTGAITVACPSSTSGSTAAPAAAELAPVAGSSCKGPGGGEAWSEPDRRLAGCLVQGQPAQQHDGLRRHADGRV
jgi:hypothetical protein